MITLVTIKNPFEPWNGRETRQIESGITSKELVEQYQVPGAEMLVVANGTEVDENYVTKDGDFIVVSAVVGKGGKNIFGMILAIGLSVFAGAIIGANALAGIGITSGTFGAYMVATAVMFLGNFLVGRMMGQDVDTGSYGKENPTYSWAGVQTMQGQNNAVALTYGTVVSGGQTIGKYVNTVDNEEYLNWLVACGEGELEITDIKNNENDVSYFEGVDVEVREGTNTQSVIPNFNDTYFTKPLQYVLDDTERIDTAQGNGTEGIIVKVEFQKGLWHSTNEGKITTAWVRLLGYYRQGTDGEWIPFVYEKTTENEYIVSVDSAAPEGNYSLYVADSTVGTGDDAQTVTTARITYPDSTSLSKTISRGTQFTLGYFKVLIPNDEETPSTINETFAVAFVGAKITGSQTSPLRKEFRVDNLPADEYYVKMSVTARSHSTTDTRSAVECTWSAITSIVYDDFCYPNIALIGIKALATNQLNGNPTLKFTKTKSKVWVWNPHNEQYEEKNANNPAWASYDILHLCRYLEDPNNLGHYEYVVGGVSADRMLYDQFEEWAEFCEDKGLYVNIEINQLGEMLDVINQKVAPIGHGRVLRFGTRYGCNWDCSKLPVQMFGMGNIKAGTFQEQFLPTNDRANAVELTYTDADNGFERETITIMAEDYDTATEVKTAQATFDGITSYDQAYREGKYQLFCNRYRIRTVTFEADIDSISCTIGDVVLVAHDVPKWAKSGRIYKVEGDVLTLPVELSDSTLNYRILYRTVNDNMYTSNCEILSNADGWCVIKVAEINSADPPQANDIFDIAVQNIGSKPFIIQNISRAKDFTRRIDCIEYDERIYSEDYDIPEIEYTEVDLRPKNVTNLVAREYSTTVGYHIDVSWQQASAGAFNVYFFDGENWRLMVEGLKVNQYSADVEYNAVQVRVVTVNGIIASSGTVASVENIDNVVSALKVENLKAKAMMDGNVATVTATWDSVLASNFKNYFISFRDETINTLDTTAEFYNVPQGVYTLSVMSRTIDNGYGTPTDVTVSAGEITDNTTAYAKTVPAYKTSAKLQEIGGRTVVWNQLVNTGTTSVPTQTGRKYYAYVNGTANIVTSSGSAISITDSTKDMVVDLTLLMGRGNEFASVSEFQEMFPAQHYNYNAGTLLSASVDKVIGVDTYNIPASVQGLAGYGWSAGGKSNYIDFANKKYVQNVDRVDLGSLTWTYYTTSSTLPMFYADVPNGVPVASGSATSFGFCSKYAFASNNGVSANGISNAGNGYIAQNGRTSSARILITEPNYTTATDFKNSVSGVYMYYQLSTPIETDISAYIDGSNIVEVDGGGTLEFHNSNGNGYRLPIPSTEIYN